AKVAAAPGKEREDVFGVLSYTDAEKATVDDTDPAIGGVLHLETQAIGGLFGHTAGRLEVHRASGGAFLDQGPKGHAIGGIFVPGETGVESVLVAPAAIPESVTFWWT